MFVTDRDVYGHKDIHDLDLPAAIVEDTNLAKYDGRVRWSKCPFFTQYPSGNLYFRVANGSAETKMECWLSFCRDNDIGKI